MERRLAVLGLVFSLLVMVAFVVAVGWSIRSGAVSDHDVLVSLVALLMGHAFGPHAAKAARALWAERKGR